MPGRRVFITGIGAITPIGSGVEGLWSGVCKGRRAAGPLSRFDPAGLRSRIAAEVACFDPGQYMEPRKARRLDRFAQFSIAASRQAVADAGLELNPVLRESMAVFLGSALGGVAFGEAEHTRFLERGIGSVDPALAIAVFGGAGPAHVSIDLGITGPILGNANSCASGVIALGEAFRLLRSGASDVALAGGAEAPLAPLTFGAFDRIHAMTSRNGCPDSASRPFDGQRDGFLMGEGAAVLVLEEEQHALSRGAKPYAEVIGYAVTSDAHNMVAPLPTARQAARAMSNALRDADIAAEQVDYVNAHATSTVLGDAAEASAIRQALGVHAERAWVSGTKGQHGHALGASGAIETAITVMAMQYGWLPPTANLTDAAPDCQLRHVPAGGVSAEPQVAIKNSFGFGGINASLVLRAV